MVFTRAPSWFSRLLPKNSADRVPLRLENALAAVLTETLGAHQMLRFGTDHGSGGAAVQQPDAEQTNEERHIDQR